MKRNQLYVAILGVMVTLTLMLSGCTSTAVSTTLSTTTSATGTPTGEPCPKQYVQKFDPRKAGRFYSNGVENSEEDLEYLGQDALALAYRAYAISLLSELKLVDTPKPDKLLEPGGKCLSREGQDIYLQVRAALLSEVVDENGQAPSTGYNTGVHNGQAGIDANPGIGGNTDALVYTLRNGNKIYVMKRCGNLVFIIKIIELPTVPTEHLRPPCPADMPHGVWPVCKDDPDRDPAAQNNAPDQVQGVAPAADPVSSPPPVQRTPTSKYTAPPAPAPTKVVRPPAPAPTQEPSTPPSPAPDPSPTINNCEVNPDFCPPPKP